MTSKVFLRVSVNAPCLCGDHPGEYRPQRHRAGTETRKITLFTNLTGDLDWLGSRRRHARSDVMKLGGLDHVQAMIANGLKSRQDLLDWRAHHTFAPFVSGEIEVEMLAHKTIGHPGKSIERIFDSV